MGFTTGDILSTSDNHLDLRGWEDWGMRIGFEFSDAQQKEGEDGMEQEKGQ